MEILASRTNDHKVVVKFVKEYIFYRYETPRALISDGGSHFCHQSFEDLLRKYCVTHKVAIPYHLETGGQVNVSDLEIKSILEKWFDSMSLRLHDTLLAYSTAYKSPIEISSYQLVFGKASHLLVELEQRAFWTIKAFNFDMKQIGSNRRP